MSTLDDVEALTFDVFGTILDLGSSLRPPISRFLAEKGVAISPDQLWDAWRARQRLEQFQDTIMMLGHGGYLETVRRALVYALRLCEVPHTDEDVASLMEAWQMLSPFNDVQGALPRLASKYRLVVLSNGDPEFLEHLAANRIGWTFDQVISVTRFGAFKPHPAVYRGAAGSLGLEVGQCMMVSANSFDVVGARACGFRAALLTRYGLPYEDTPYQPDIVVNSFAELADAVAP